MPRFDGYIFTIRPQVPSHGSIITEETIAVRHRVLARIATNPLFQYCCNAKGYSRGYAACTCRPRPPVL